MCTTTEIFGRPSGHRVANLILYFWLYFLFLSIYTALVVSSE
jgi:hypothetical protein